MARPKKDNVPMSLRIERSIFEQLNQFCEDSGQPKTVAIERALQMYMDDYYKRIGKVKKAEDAES